MHSDQIVSFSSTLYFSYLLLRTGSNLWFFDMNNGIAMPTDQQRQSERWSNQALFPILQSFKNDFNKASFWRWRLHPVCRDLQVCGYHSTGAMMSGLTRFLPFSVIRIKKFLYKLIVSLFFDQSLVLLLFDFECFGGNLKKIELFFQCVPDRF